MTHRLHEFSEPVFYRGIYAGAVREARCGQYEAMLRTGRSLGLYGDMRAAAVAVISAVSPNGGA